MARHARHVGLREIWRLLVVPVVLGILAAGLFIGFVDHLGHGLTAPRATVSHSAVGHVVYPKLTPPTLPRPAQPHPEVLTYHVRTGDTLWGIAGTHCSTPLDWHSLWHANHKLIHNPNLIYPKMVIHLVC